MYDASLVLRAWQEEGDTIYKTHGPHREVP
jgi:hypothetical protein